MSEDKRGKRFPADEVPAVDPEILRQLLKDGLAADGAPPAGDARARLAGRRRLRRMLRRPRMRISGLKARRRRLLLRHGGAVGTAARHLAAAGAHRPIRGKSPVQGKSPAQGKSSAGPERARPLRRLEAKAGVKLRRAGARGRKG